MVLNFMARVLKIQNSCIYINDNSSIESKYNTMLAKLVFKKSFNLNNCKIAIYRIFVIHIILILYNFCDQTLNPIEFYFYIFVTRIFLRLQVINVACMHVYFMINL